MKKKFNLPVRKAAEILLTSHTTIYARISAGLLDFDTEEFKYTGKLRVIQNAKFSKFKKHQGKK